MKKTTPCKFKGKCNKYTANQPCEYSHERCKRGPSCERINNCRYFHEEVHEALPMGTRVNRDQPLLISKECKNGAACQYLKKNNCQYFHSSSHDHHWSKSRPPQKTEGEYTQQANQTTLQSSQDIIARVVRGPQCLSQVQPLFMQRLCIANIASSCTNKQCRLEHGFVLNHEISRIFVGRVSGLQCALVYKHEAAMYYVLQRRNRVNFYTVESASRLLGEGRAEDDERVLRAVQPTSFDLHEGIISLRVIGKWLVCGTADSTVLFDPIRGEVRRQSGGGAVLGGCLLGDSLWLLMGGRVYGWDVLSNAFGPLNLLSAQLVFLKHGKLCGSNVVVLGDADGRVYFCNETMRSREIALEGTIIDCAFIIREGLPLCFCIVRTSAESHIHAINLIDFKTMLVSKSTEKYRAIFEIKELLYVHVQSLGVVIFEKDFSKAVGMLSPISVVERPIECIDTDGQSTIVIREMGESPILAIYGLRR